jgi:hypothetical protein
LEDKMNGLMEARLRTRRAPEEIEAMVGKILTPQDVVIQLRGPSKVLKPDGKPLAIYLPGVLAEEGFIDGFYPLLHELRRLQTTNRGMAGGAPREKAFAEGSRTYSPAVASGIIGSFDERLKGSKEDPKKPAKTYCRLTAWSGHEWDQYATLFPLFTRISELFSAYVPDRWQRQMAEVQRTHPDWVIPGTAFTTITINNSYPTGVHTDKGDLDEGFSTLCVLRRGNYSGGFLTFPEYGVGVDMQHGDLLLMDAHEWHGNTYMECDVCGEPISGTKFHDACETERISVVSYFRTRMTECGSMDDELEKKVAADERRISMSEQLIEEQALEAVG